MNINLLPKKTWKQTLWKTLNIVSSITLIFNMSMVGVFLTPKVTTAAEVDSAPTQELTVGDQSCDDGLCPPDLHIKKYVRLNNSGNWLTFDSGQIAEAQPGDLVNYMIKLWNTGSGTGITNVVDTINGGTDDIFVSLIRPQLTNVTLLGGATVEPDFVEGGNTNGSTNYYVYVYEGTLKDGYPQANHAINKAQLTQNGQYSRAKVRVNYQCHLTIEKSVDKINALPGDTLTYNIHYLNDGSANCTGGGVMIFDNLDDNLSYVNGSLSAVENYGNGDGISLLYHFNGVDPLANAHVVIPGESGDINFQATVSENLECGITNIPNKTKIWSNETGHVWSNEVNTEIYKACYGNGTVIKHVVGGNAVASDWTMHVNGPEDYSFPGEESPGTSKDVLIGDYVITESGGPTGYTLSYSGDCDADGNMTINEGEHKICILTNTRVTGGFTIHKYDELQQPQAGVTFTVEGQVTQSGQTDHNGTLVFNDLPTGQYMVTETEPQNYHFVSVTGDCSPNKNPTNVTITTDNQSCTFTNSRNMGTVRVNKDVFGPNGENVTNDNHAFIVRLNGDTTIEQPISEPSVQAVFTVPVGITQTITENDDPDYLFWDYSYDEDPNTPGAQITITETEQGKEKIIFVQNKQKPATITVIKDVRDYLGNDISDNNTFKLNSNTYSFSENSPLNLTVNPGTYTGSEDGDPLYTLHNIIGDNDNDPTNGATVTVDSNGSVTLTFVNYRNAGNIMVHKNVVAPDGQTEVNDNHDFTVQLDGANDQIINESSPHTFVGLPTGQYTISEIPDLNHDFVKFTDLNGNEITMPVSVNNGEITHVIIVNKQYYGTISGYKWSDENGNGLWDADETGLADWTINLWSNNENGLLSIIDSTLTDENGYYKFNELMVDTYYLNEGENDGWMQTSSPAVIGPIAIASGTVSENNNFGNQRIYPDLSVAKTDGLTTANAGQTITYSMVVTNHGAYVADNVHVSDTLPPQATYVSSTMGGADMPAIVTLNALGDMLEWNLGNMNVSDTKTLAVTVQLDNVFSFGTTNLHNAVTVSTTSTEPNTADNSAFDDTNVTAAPVLGLTKTATAQVNAGENITYTITWSVNGNSQATQVVLTDPIPTNSVFVSADQSGAFADATKTVTWNLGTKNPGDHGTVTMIVKANSPLTNNTVITNIASLDSLETDPAVTAKADTVVKAAPVLTITKVVDATTFVNPGATVNYTVTIKNTGLDTAINVRLTDLLPAGFLFTDFGGSSHTFALGNLTAGAHISVTYKVTIGAAVNAGTFENLAVASADNYGNVTAKAPVEVRLPQVLGEEAKPELAIVKTVDRQFINPGDSAVYTIKITNQGDAPAVNVQLQDILPAGFTFENNDITKVWSLGDIAVGASVTVTYRALSDKTILPGQYQNLAVAWADNNDKVSTSIKLDVRQVKVLGAELPKTGVSLVDYLYFFLAGLILLFSLYIMKLTFSRNE